MLPIHNETCSWNGSRKIEETKEIAHAYFFPIENGTIEKGDFRNHKGLSDKSQLWYSRWHLGEWKMVISEEDVQTHALCELLKGDVIGVMNIYAVSVRGSLRFFFT
uniref:Uncharacterized protein n=1 Tax=Geoglobus ahangari TaxID=113653 RepID=A0A7C3UD87_9EURY